MQEKIKVLLGDDNPFSRSGLRALLRTFPEVNLIGTAEDGADALSRIQIERPDVVLMDVKMPRLNGLQTTQRIKQRWPDVKVILISMYVGYRSSAEQAGADHFLLKGASPAEILEAILN
jgi:YesN/AraC family two-component response regulator